MGSTSSRTVPHISLWPTQWRVVIPALWATFIINVLGLALPLAALQIYNRMLAENTPGRWLMMLGGVFAAILLEGLLRLARAHIAGQLGGTQEQQHTLTLLGHMLHSRGGSRSAGQSLQTLEALAKLRDFSSGQVLTVLLDVPFALIYLGLVAYLGGILVLIPVGLLFIFMGREFSQGTRMAHAMRRREETDILRKNGLIEAMERLHTVKAFGRLRWLQRRLELQQYAVEQATAPVSRIACQVYQDGLLFSQLMLASLTMAGTPLVLSGQMTLGALMACVLVGGRLMAPIQRGLGLYSRIQDTFLARERINGALHQPIVFGRPPRGQNMRHRGEDFDYPATLHLDNIGLRGTVNEAQTGRWLLRQVNLQAERGQTIALSTNNIHTGTLLMLALAGLRPATEGKVLLDGAEPHTLSAGELVRHIAYLPPEGTIYRGSIYENLSRFGQTPAARVAEMIELLELEPALAVLPHGVDTMLDNTLADPLPPGFKQRVTIARILAGKPRVILFNHADSSLDQAGYNIMYRLLERLKGKVLLILFTDDRNLVSLADEHWIQQGSTLRRKLFIPALGTENNILNFRQAAA